ncbi:hypothetical protein FISHEDRAFT_61666 [Fistulina hepatica ATCC 64428]|uniref:Uncharacterized protein n=1 Tax=Fistulina hepatica ATCC 64428 TaxID=1128425 RepID=A0A0D7A380_9AGAR|nr:hypothetical protein FISHEDRAFT_61666 [Fistulina hepatica ATCC 64428]
MTCPDRTISCFTGLERFPSAAVSCSIHLLSVGLPKRARALSEVWVPRLVQWTGFLSTRFWSRASFGRRGSRVEECSLSEQKLGGWRRENHNPHGAEDATKRLCGRLRVLPWLWTDHLGSSQLAAGGAAATDYKCEGGSRVVSRSSYGAHYGRPHKGEQIERQIPQVPSTLRRGNDRAAPTQDERQNVDKRVLVYYAAAEFTVRSAVKEHGRL